MLCTSRWRIVAYTCALLVRHIDWGLRDYGTATWEGGDPACDHKVGCFTTPASDKQKSNNGSGDMGARDVCPKCGARRVDQQLGLEPVHDCLGWATGNPCGECYVCHLVAVFREVKRVLRPDGVVFLNLGDSYASIGHKKSNSGHGTTGLAGGIAQEHSPLYRENNGPGLKHKDLAGIPWRVAFALQADGWWLRQDIIWAKPNPMPESVADRCTKSHEYVFLLSKSARYYYDAEAVREPLADATIERDKYGRPRDKHKWFAAGVCHSNEGMPSHFGDMTPNQAGRNRRSVWTVTTQPFSGTKLMTDYVGPDGKPYRASPDCPIHGHLARSRKICTAQCDEQPTAIQSRSLDTDAGRDPSLAPLLDAMTSRNSSGAGDESARQRTHESNHDSKSEAAHREHTLGARTPSRTNHTSESREQMDYNQDSQGQLCVPPAIERSTQNHRTDHEFQTSQRDNASCQTPSRTQSTLWSDEHTDSVDRKRENNSAESDCCDSHRTETASHIAHTETPLAPSVSSCTSTTNYTCTCKIVNIDHFATMPPKLVEPCILAGCPIGGVVLDPFFGSGTVGAVARSLGRRFIGIELNPAYIALAKERIGKVQPVLLF